MKTDFLIQNIPVNFILITLGQRPERGLSHSLLIFVTSVNFLFLQTRKHTAKKRGTTSVSFFIQQTFITSLLCTSHK